MIVAMSTTAENTAELLIALVCLIPGVAFLAVFYMIIAFFLAIPVWAMVKMMGYKVNFIQVYIYVSVFLVGLRFAYLLLGKLHRWLMS